MAKKRNCRRDPKERTEHERAVALKKMTDRQLLEHMDRQYKAGFDAGSIGIETAEQESMRKIIKTITSIKGIGAATLAKINTALEAI